MGVKERYESKNKKSNSTGVKARYDKRIRKSQLETTIGFDTFESDLNSLGKTVNSIYEGWQTEETLNNTRSSIEAMQGRISAYQDYQKQYGGGADLTELSKSYEKILGNWDKISSEYGKYKSADEYNTAKKEYEGKTKANIGELQKESKSIEKVLAKAKEYKSNIDALVKQDSAKKSASGRGGYTYSEQDQKAGNEAISNARAELDAYLKENGYKSVEELQDTFDGKKFYLEDAQRIQDEIKLNKEETKRAKSKEGKQGYDKFLADEESAKADQPSAFEDSVNRAFVTSSDNPLTTVINNVIYDKRKDTSYQKPTDDWTNAEKYTFGSYYLENPESAYDYATRLNNAKATEKKNKTKADIEESATSGFWEGAGHTAGAILTAPFGLADYFDDLTDKAAGRDAIVEESVVTPFEYSQTVTGGITNKLNDMSGTLDEDIPIVGGKGLGDLYGLGTSIAQSAVSAYTLGGTGTLISYFGQGAAAGVDDALSRGATEGQALLYGTILGAAEGISEKIGIDNLFKIGSSRTLKELFVNILKQGGAEGLEEGFSSVVGNIADNFVMRDKSNFNALIKQYMADGLSASEAKNKAWKSTIGDIAYDVLGGFVSGAAHAGPQTAIATARANSIDKAKGQAIRGNERVGETLELASLTPQGSDANNLYNQYAKKGVTAENINDKQLGHLYSSTKEGALSTIKNEKASVEEKNSAFETLGKLNHIDTDNVVKKNRDKLNVGEETIVAENNAEINGIKLGEKTTLITSEGEVSVDDVTLSEKDASIVAYAQTMSEPMANLFIEQYDGNTDVEAYANAFNLVSAYAEHNYDQNTIIEKKGVLSTDQVKAIYNATVKASFNAKQMKLDEISAKQGKTMFVQGTLDDSIIDYNSKTTDGSKVNWNTLTSRQRSAIKFVKLFTKATGVNVNLIKSNVKKGKHVGENGSYNSETNTIEIDVYAGRIDADTVKDTIIPTLSHEMTHWMKAKAISAYEGIRNDIMKTLSEKSGISSEKLINAEMVRMKKAHPDMKVTPEKAIDEIVARACQDMLTNSNEARKLLNRMSATEQQSFIEKIKETFDNLMQWINDLLAQYKNDDASSSEVALLREYKTELQRLQKQWDAMFVEAIKMNQALQQEGVKGEEVIGELAKANELQFNERLVESHFDKLKEKYSEDAAIDLDTLLERYQKIVDIWTKLGGELNSQFLEDWNNKVGKDRAFSIFKAQAGYKYNVELSSMCKKGIPLFEAIDKIVKSEVIKELNTKTLGKAEKEILYDILKEKNFEIPCAICYVEQARQREGVIIDAFLNGKIDKTNTGKITQYKLGWNETLAEIQTAMKEAGCDYTFPSLDRSIATDNYTPQDISMDEETQGYFFEALKKVANKEIRRYNKEANKNRKLITKTDAKSVNDVFKGKLPLNLAMFKTMFNEPSSRFTIDDDLLYSSMTTQNLATMHNGLYSVFNSQGGVGGYKTKQGTIVYWADILDKKWTPDKLRNEGGVRNQSNSDFLMYTLLDHAQMYIDFTAKGYYLQAYTKVLAELKLFGLSKGKINASFIPKVHEYRNSDGSVDVEKTRLNAGLDENGNLIFDDFEGINHMEAFMLLEDAEYSKSIGGVCIGYSDNHILKLLDDNRIQLIIGFHDKSNDTSKRYRGAKYSKNYNGLNEATYYGKEGNLKTKHIGFNQFVKKAEGKFKNGKQSIEYNGKTYKYNDIPKLATDLYLEHCENKGLNPAYSQGGTDFSKHTNYYKLLADFSLYDINGNYAPHQKVEYNMPDQVPYLDKNGNKAYEKTEDYIKRELGKELVVRDSISNALADKSEDGIIPEFVKRVNELHSEKQYEDRDTKSVQYCDRSDAPNEFNPDGLTLKEQLKEALDTANAKDWRYVYVGKFTDEFINKLKEHIDIKKYPIVMNYRDAYLSMEKKERGKYQGKKINYHNLGVDGLESALKSFANPEYVLLSTTNGKIELILEGRDYKNRQLFSIVEINTKTQNNQKFIDVHVVNSVYGNRSINNRIVTAKEEGRVIYDKNKESMQGIPLVQYQRDINIDSSKDIIRNPNEKVNENISNYSDRDSEGNTLTKEQIEFFKDSKVRDENGNLKVAYHGTPNGDFNTFHISDGAHSSLMAQYGAGYYFDANKDSAKRYTQNVNKTVGKQNAKVFEVYLNIKNPLVIHDEYLDGRKPVITKQQFKDVISKGNYEWFFANGMPFELTKHLGKSKAEIQQMPSEEIVNHWVDMVYDRAYFDSEILSAMVKAYKGGSILGVMKDVFGKDGVKVIDKYGEMWVAWDNSQIKDTTNTNPTSNPDIRYADRETESLYDKMGESDRIAEENKKLKADVERLVNVIGDKEISVSRFRSLADFLKKRTGNDVNREELGDMLKEAYTFIQSGKNVEWQDVMVKTNEIATFLMNRDLKVPVNYFKEVMTNVRKDTFTLSAEQRAKAEEVFGGYSNFHKAMFGRVNVTKEGTTLEERWKNWSKLYPSIFDSNVKGADQIEALANIVDTLKATSTLMGEFEREEAIRYLATEVYNQFWNIAADSNDSAKESRSKHRALMEQMRKDYEQRQKENTLHPVGETALKYETLYKKVSERKKKEIAEAKKLGKERMDAYKENAERKTKIQSITANALTLNKWLVKNSKDEHIHIAMRGPVINLLQAIDFSSKQLLGMKGSANKGTPTRNDISLQKALSEVKDMMADASVGKAELIELYGHGLDDDIKELVSSVDNMMRTVGDNEFILNKMSLAELETLDKIVKTIKHSVSKMNKFHTVQHKQGIANLSEEGIGYLDKLGKAVKHSGIRGKLDYLLKWNNTIPYYAFKRLGDAGQKVFEALQDGWDKLAHNAKQITDFTNKTYSNKEVRDWGKQTKTFTINQPDGSKRTFDITIAQIMALHCVSKQEDAKRHLLSSGMTIAEFDNKGKVTSEEDNILLGIEDIATITGSLDKRQLEVANKLQEFMNTICADWGNEISMQRFAVEMFTTPDYFPIKVSPSTITKEEPKDVNDVSLFRLLNMSFTKARNEFANQSIEIGNIFDIFAQHTSDMAKYNALALPVLDVYRWYSYKGQTTIGKEYSTYASLQKALGKDSVRYFNTFMKDLNGASNVARDNFGSNFFRNAKLASVAANLRVVLLQPTAYLKASAIIDNRYLTQAFLHKPKIAKAEKYCGMALWKSMGYYDVNITKGLTEKIKHEDTWRDKTIEFSMKGAEVADKITFGYLWNACELEIRKTRKDLKVGSEEFYTTIGKRLREVIYATQVVDSTMTRSQIMRSSDGWDKMLTAFMSEPTLAYNMLMDCVITTNLDKRENGKGAFKRNFKRNSRVFIAYVTTNMLAALVESCFDVFRDDEEDEDEETLVEFTRHYLTNFTSDMSIIGKIPYLKELPSLLQGYSPSRTDTQWMESLVYAGEAWKKIFTGEGEGKGVKAVEHSLRAFSNVSGLAFFNVYRDLMAALNKLDILTAEELEELFDELFGY